ncbi:MAG: hypothetical protein K0R44_3719 [Thermomicrobiales bacterium]|nr:hypothetical protein [Thermomicrobiales bacterium]
MRTSACSVFPPGMRTKGGATMSSSTTEVPAPELVTASSVTTAVIRGQGSPHDGRKLSSTHPSRRGPQHCRLRGFRALRAEAWISDSARTNPAGSRAVTVRPRRRTASGPPSHHCWCPPTCTVDRSSSSSSSVTATAKSCGALPVPLGWRGESPWPGRSTVITSRSAAQVVDDRVPGWPPVRLLTTATPHLARSKRDRHDHGGGRLRRLLHAYHQLE